RSYCAVNAYLRNACRQEQSACHLLVHLVHIVVATTYIDAAGSGPRDHPAICSGRQEVLAEPDGRAHLGLCAGGRVGRGSTSLREWEIDSIVRKWRGSLIERARQELTRMQLTEGFAGARTIQDVLDRLDAEIERGVREGSRHVYFTCL